MDFEHQAVPEEGTDRDLNPARMGRDVPLEWFCLKMGSGPVALHLARSSPNLEIIFFY